MIPRRILRRNTFIRTSLTLVVAQFFFCSSLAITAIVWEGSVHRHSQFKTSPLENRSHQLRTLLEHKHDRQTGLRAIQASVEYCIT